MHTSLPASRNPRRLILFGRYPVPGRVKTRLIPALGPVGAAELQRRLTEQALDLVLPANLASAEFCYTGGTLLQMRRWLANRKIDLTPQAEGHLGQRMQAALETALGRGYGQAVLVGTDIPHITVGHLAAAFEALGQHDVVLGPSVDGGYWLVGCRRPVDIFSNIAWGTPQVLSQTLAAAQKQRLSVAQLPPLNDIDTEADLLAWDPHRSWRRPYLSVVIPTLNEAKGIGTAIEGARSPDAEILVVDGGSSDDTVSRARQAGARVMSAPQGRARQQNAGAKEARGDVLLFLHADTCLPTDYAAQVFETLLDSRVVLGAFHFKTDFDHWAMRLIEKSVHIRATWFKMPYGDQALFMRNIVFDQLGGFPEVTIAEDLFLVRRLARLGRICLAPGSAVTSGRRWRRIGIGRATLINYLIAGGCLLGIPPRRLASLYRLGAQPKPKRG